MPNYIVYIGFAIISFLGYFFTYGTQYFTYLFALMYFIFWASKLIFMLKSAKTHKLENKPLSIHIAGLGSLICFFSMFALLYIFYIDRPDFKYLHIFLATVFSLALLLWRHSMQYMGYLFADGIYKPEKLIINGPFLLVRNPIYFSYTMFFLPASVYILTISNNSYVYIQLMLWLLFIYLGRVYIKYRIAEEERVLLAFGEDFVRYKTETPRLIPTPTSFIRFMKNPF